MKTNLLRIARGALMGVAALLAGCASLSGVGGESHYACPAPQGVRCGSVTANYLQSLPGDRPGQFTPGRVTELESAETAAEPAPAQAAPTAYPDAATPLRSPPRILKLWVAPWEDRDGVLHDAAFVFVPIDHGRWLLRHGRPATRIQDRFVAPSGSSIPARTAGPAALGLATDPASLPAPVETQDDHAQ
jgi:conjugal transfer pilus assembly protein TraV